MAQQVKDRLLNEKKSIESAEQRRKQRDTKKFGKQVQVGQQDSPALLASMKRGYFSF
jgi:hypothetical protein